MPTIRRSLLLALCLAISAPAAAQRGKGRRPIDKEPTHQGKKKKKKHKHESKRKAPRPPGQMPRHRGHKVKRPAPPATPPGQKKKRRAPPAPDRGWRVRKPIEISAFSPTSGAPGTAVAISGRHFGPRVTVRFNGRALRITERHPHRLVVVIPKSAVTDSFVLSKPGFSDVTAEAPFQVVRPPTIRHFHPPRGDPGITVTIRGTNFVDSDRLVLGSKPMKITSWRPRQLTAVVPPGAVSGRIGVQRAGRVLAWSRRAFEVNLPPPQITSFSPQRGPAGTLVRIAGRNFDLNDQVTLAGRRLPIKRRGPTFVEVVVGNHPPGRFVVVGRGGRRAVAPSDFVVIQPPRVRGFSPNFGPPGTQIVIRGQGFTAGDQVVLGAAQLTVRTISHHRIVAELPAGVPSGRISVRRGGRNYPARGIFRVVEAPTITQVTPPNGPVGTVVTIHGSAFLPGVSVLLAGRPLPIVQRRLPNQLRVRIPPGARTGQLVVVTQGGSTRWGNSFVVNRPATLAAFFPLKGLAGTRVTLKGRDFHAGMRVLLGNTLLQLSRITPNRAVVVIPPGVPSGRFTIESHGTRTVSRLPFTVLQPAPALSFTFTPTSVSRGQEVTLNVTPPRETGITVFLNGRPLPKRVLAGGRQLVVTIPGDMRGTGRFEIQYRGRRYPANQVLRIR